MSKNKLQHHVNSSIVAVKSKFDADIVRFSINRNETTNYENFRKLLAERHDIGPDFNFNIYYTDPTDGDLLPINNDNNLARALVAAKPLLRILIQRQGEGLEDMNGSNTLKHKNILSSILSGTPGKPKPLAISNPHDFRQVSAIIDVDILPETCRRVKLLKHGLDKPLGFFIKDGESYRVGPNGSFEKVPGVFISRLVPGGLAEGTGLLAANDEVLEVNGIEVAGKSLDQVTDMMIANASNLIITVKPANQRTALSAPRRGSFSRNSQFSSGSQQSMQSAQSAPSGSDEEMDKIVDLTSINIEDDASSSSHHQPHHHHHHHHDQGFSHHDQGVLHL